MSGKEQSNPQHVEAELRTHLRVRCNAAWIVVCRSGNQARAQAVQQISDWSVFGDSYPFSFAESRHYVALVNGECVKMRLFRRPANRTKKPVRQRRAAEITDVFAPGGLERSFKL